MDDDKKGRENKRRTVVLRGVVLIGNYRFPCRVRDLSAGGARVQTDVPLANATPVHLELGRHGRFPAVVAWTEGELMGLVFPEGSAGALARFGEHAENLGLLGEPDDAPTVARLPR